MWLSASSGLIVTLSFCWFVSCLLWIVLLSTMYESGVTVFWMGPLSLKARYFSYNFPMTPVKASAHRSHCDTNKWVFTHSHLLNSTDSCVESSIPPPVFWEEPGCGNSREWLHDFLPWVKSCWNLCPLLIQSLPALGSTKLSIEQTQIYWFKSS